MVLVIISHYHMIFLIDSSEITQRLRDSGTEQHKKNEACLFAFTVSVGTLWQHSRCFSLQQPPLQSPRRVKSTTQFSYTVFFWDVSLQHKTHKSSI